MLKSAEAHLFQSQGEGLGEEGSVLEQALTGMVREQRLLEQDADVPTKVVFGVRVPVEVRSKDEIFMFHIHIERLKLQDPEMVARHWRTEVQNEIPVQPNSMLATRRERVMEQYRLTLLAEAALKEVPMTFNRAKAAIMILEELGVVMILARGVSAALTKFYALLETGWMKKRSNIPLAVTKAIEGKKCEEASDPSPPASKQLRSEQPQLLQQPRPLQQPIQQQQFQQQFQQNFRGPGQRGFRGRGFRSGRGRGGRGFS